MNELKIICIGVKRYSGKKGKRIYIQCINSYSEHDDAIGYSAFDIIGRYEDFSLFIPYHPSFDNPVIVTAELKTVFYGTTQNTECGKILNIEHLKSA